jgi:hypothetical protein
LRAIVLFFASILIISFSACSSKKVYEPKIVQDDWNYYGDSNESIVDITSDVALLEDGKVLSKDSFIDVSVDESHRLVGKSDGWIISSNIDGNLTLQFIADKSMVEHFELKKTIASASVKDDILAVLFADNEMCLYSVSTKELLLKEQGNAPMAVDSRIVNPYFMNDLVLFLTLDGKVVIINSSLKKKLRTIIVSSEDHFNNIIYFNVIDSKLIAVTASKILSLGEKEIRVKYEVRNVVYDGKNIFITTKQGEVISLTPALQVNAKVKFPFAHFLGMIAYEDNLYVLEKEGYMIKLSKDLLTYSVHEVDIEDGYIFVADKKFFVDDEYISVVQ